MTYGGMRNDRKDKTGSMNRTPTLGKIRKDIDSHFHGNDIYEYMRAGMTEKERDGHDSSYPYIKRRKCKCSKTMGGFLNH